MHVETFFIYAPKLGKREEKTLWGKIGPWKNKRSDNSLGRLGRQENYSRGIKRIVTRGKKISESFLSLKKSFWGAIYLGINLSKPDLFLLISFPPFLLAKTPETRSLLFLYMVKRNRVARTHADDFFFSSFLFFLRRP